MQLLLIKSRTKRIVRKLRIDENHPLQRPISYYLTESTIVEITASTSRWIFLTYQTRHRESTMHITKLLDDPAVPCFRIIVNPNVKCRLFINYESSGYFCEIIDVGEGAEVLRHGINATPRNTNSFHQCNINRNARIDNKVLAISLAQDRKIFQIEMNHLADRAEGTVTHRQLLNGGYIEVNCISNIPKVANCCVAKQKLRSILFDSKATALNRPILNIFNKNVVATHASAIGRINPAEIYYLNTRGFIEKTIYCFIIMGYLAELFTDVNKEFKDLYIKKIILILDIKNIHV